jgi:hypothetical protein
MDAKFLLGWPALACLAIELCVSPAFGSLLRHPGEIRVALGGLERLLQEKYRAGKRLKSLGGEIPCVNLVRYADDFTVAHTATGLGNTAMLRKRRPWVGWTAPLAGWGSI